MSSKIISDDPGAFPLPITLPKQCIAPYAQETDELVSGWEDDAFCIRGILDTVISSMAKLSLYQTFAALTSQTVLLAPW